MKLWHWFAIGAVVLWWLPKNSAPTLVGPRPFMSPEEQIRLQNEFNARAKSNAARGIIA